MLVVDDDDAMFIRNSSRGMMSRKGIEEAVESELFALFVSHPSCLWETRERGTCT